MTANQFDHIILIVSHDAYKCDFYASLVSRVCLAKSSHFVSLTGIKAAINGIQSNQYYFVFYRNRESFEEPPHKNVENLHIICFVLCCMHIS